jgi:CheY-like chemotaxis protein
MVNVRPRFEHRFNVLLTQDRPRAAPHWTDQLSRLLEPQGVVSHVARTAREAIDLAERTELHAAVIDTATPLGSSAQPAQGDGGMWLLQLLHRLPNRPPVIIVRMPAFTPSQAERALREALRLGAFSVMDKPVDVEQLLGVFRRLMDKRYHGTWPNTH